MNTRPQSKLLAIVSVEHGGRVRCGQPGCGHSVYRQIHVVRDGGELMVLGSTCFAKRYGSSNALGAARFSGSGGGRLLTNEELQLLLSNTEALLARFENERSASLSQTSVVRHDPVEVRPSPVLVVLERPQVGKPVTLERPNVSAVKESPWSWMKPMSSTIYFRLRDGSGWVRVQRNDSEHLLVPWPTFTDWDKTFTPHIGTVDTVCQAYVLPDVASALAHLRSLARWETKPGRWQDVATEIAKKSRW
jgi:hypothetical protein